MPFSVKVNASATTLKLDALPGRLRGKLLSTVQLLDQELLSVSRAKATDDILQVHSGKYLASLKGLVRDTDKKISGVVYSDAPQAELMEWGGTIPFHEILPNVAQALMFMGAAGPVFAAAVVMPDVTIKKHPVLHSALYQMHQQILSEMSAAVHDTAREPA